MKDILMINHFTLLSNEKGNSRFEYLVKLLVNEGNKVEVVTSTFSHSTKMQRNFTNQELEMLDYKITLIDEPGYSKNVSLQRFYSHYKMSKNLSNYLHNRHKPDFIYCSVPSLDVPEVAARYARDNNVKFIIDIQDLWPEAFQMLFDIPVISDLIFHPLNRKADFIYSLADEIVAVSETYANRASKINKKCKYTHSIFLGTDLECFDKLAQENKLNQKHANEIWLAYVGTLGHSYDLICVIDALKIVQKQGISNIKFIVMGDGPLKDKFENYANNQGVVVEFMGSLEYGKMVGILTSCDIAVNPITHGAAQSITNKHGDYAASGLPILNTQECEEYRSLVQQYNCGLNCENNNPHDLAKNLLTLFNDEILRKKMGKNSRKLAVDRFDRNQTYKKILELFEG